MITYIVSYTFRIKQIVEELERLTVWTGKV